jgi:hypothetical protein
MIATVEHKGRKFKVGEYDDGKVAFDASERFIASKGWTGCKMSFENTEDDLEMTLKI